MQAARQVSEHSYRLLVPNLLSLQFGCCLKVSERKSVLLLITQVHMHTKHPSITAAAYPISTARLLCEKNREISQSKHGWSCHSNQTAPSRFLCFCHFLYPFMSVVQPLGLAITQLPVYRRAETYHPSCSYPFVFSSISHERKQPCKALLAKLHRETGTIWQKHGFRLDAAHLGQKHLFPPRVR